MKNTKTLEILVGGFMILGILGLVFLAYKVSSINNIGKDGVYTIYARFKSVSGLKDGSPVTIAGVRVGQVNNIILDKENYDARVALAIDKNYDNIPIDSSISVLTQGLLGEKYLGIDIGAEVEYFKNNDEFNFTKSAIILEKLIDRFFFKKTVNDAK